jgi:hypothetical protein
VSGTGAVAMSVTFPFPTAGFPVTVGVFPSSLLCRSYGASSLPAVRLEVVPDRPQRCDAEFLPAA